MNTSGSQRLRDFLLGVAGMGLFFVAWQVIGVYRLAGLTWPPLTDVLAMLVDPARFELFRRALSATLSAFASGYLAGGVCGIVFATIAHTVPALKEGADRLTAIIHAIPSIALAPIFIVLLSRETTPVAMSALNVFFVAYVSTTSGLRTASRSHHDVFTAFGSSPVTRFFRLELPAAMPALASGIKLAVPAGLIGTIIGEWFGAPRGLGLLIVSAMQNFQIPLLWSAVLLATATSLGLFGLATLLERFAYGRFR